MRNEFTERLRERMDLLDVTQDDMVEALCASKYTVRNYLNGTVQPGKSALRCIAKLLDTTTEYLLTGEEP